MRALGRGTRLLGVVGLALLAVGTWPELTVGAAPASVTLQDIDGRAFIFASDNQYLGRLSSNVFLSDSVCNTFGEYGSKYSSTSIRNDYSSYGSPYSSMSAYNEYTSTPPVIVYERAGVGVLTKNRYMRGAVDPDVLFAVYNCS